MYREYAVKLWKMASPDASLAVIQHSSILLSFFRFTQKHGALKPDRQILHKYAFVASFGHYLILDARSRFWRSTFCLPLFNFADENYAMPNNPRRFRLPSVARPRRGKREHRAVGTQ